MSKVAGTSKLKKDKRTSLVVNLVVSVGLVIILLNIIQTLFLARTTRASIRSDDEEDYVMLAEAYALAMQNDIEGYYNALDIYVNNDISQSGDYDAAVRWVQAHAADRNKDFDYILICDNSGLAYSDLGGQTEIGTRSYFTAIFRDGKDRFIDDPVISKTTGQPVVHVTRALKANGRIYALICGVLNVNSITEEVNAIKVGEAGYAWMLASDGTVITHPVKEYVMAKNFITGLSAGFEDMADVARKVAGGQAGFGWVSGLGGYQDLITFHGVGGTPWGLALSIPGRQVESLASDLTRYLIVFAMVVVLITLVVSGFLLIRALKPLSVVELAITDIASGDADLTRRIDINSNNEIGQVVKGFNQFTGKLHAIISDVKNSKNDLTVAGEDMSASAQDTAASITQIIANIESMQHQITNQNASVDETAGAVNQIASNISSLEHMIETQSSGVTQASAAVEEMIGNITSVNQSVDKMASSFGALQQNAQSGIGKQQAVNERIQQIEQQSAMLQEANAAISAIAEQTNLLAMNAAIEAAHAGDAGKGFSVVADEIRKLSETSTSQSKTIGDQLNNIKDSIAEVVTASADSSAAFESVSRLIKETDQLVTQIKSAMEEQQEGSQQITEALHSMNDSTVEVRNAAGEMNEGNKAILNEVRRLQEVTSAMKGSMEEMSVGARKINETGAALSSISDKVKESIVQIGNQIDLFKV